MTFRIGPFIEVDTVRGDPMPVAGRRIIPISRVLTLSLGRRRAPVGGGVVWAYPLAVEVTEAGASRRLAVPMMNWRLQFGMAAALVAALALRWTLRPRQRHAAQESEEDLR